MAKKTKKTVKRKTSRKKTITQKDLINQLVQNNISLQEKNIELIKSMNQLTLKISEMVKLFEEASKHIKEGRDEPLTQKLEKLLDQNKVIANGLILLEKYVRDKSVMNPPSSFSPKPLNKPNL